MNLNEFKVYRGKLIKQSKVIKVEVSDFEIQVTGDTAQVSFKQDYISDYIKDHGIKTLTFKRVESDWKILAETWKPLKAQSQMEKSNGE